MPDPTINFVGSALVESGGQILPLEFNSPYILAWIFRGNVPAKNWHVGWIQPLINTDLGENIGDQIQNLYIGQRKISFNLHPFDPPYRIQIIPKNWIAQLEGQFYELEPAPSGDSPSGNTGADVYPPNLL